MKNVNWVYLTLLSLTLFLPACSAQHDETSETATDPTIKQMMEEPKLVHKDDPFEMKLNIETTTFEVGEPIGYSASLTYIGDETLSQYGALKLTLCLL